MAQSDGGAGGGAGANTNANANANANGGGATPWYGEIPADRADLRTWVEGKGFQNPVAALESYYNAEKLLGAPQEQIIRLPKPDDTAAWEQVWSRLGRPEKPELYELPVPEGDDGEFAKFAAQVFHKAGIPKGAAQAIATAVNEHVAARMQAQRETWEKQAEQELNALRDEWGAEFDKRAEFGRRGLKVYGEKAGLTGDDISALEHAIGTAKLVKLFHALGETLSEADLGGGGSGGGSMSMTPAQAKAKLEELRLQRIKGEIAQDDYMRQVDELAPIASKAA